VRIRYRPPYDWDAMLAHLRARAVDGVEHVDAARYARTLVVGSVTGIVEVVHRPEIASLAATVRFSSIRPLPAIVAAVRRVFDVAADVGALGAHLARDPLLAPLVRDRPGLRTPGAWDGFELAVRAILGQQVSVEAARRLAGQLARTCGTRVGGAGSMGTDDRALTLAFPTAAQIAGADLDPIGMPAARRRTIVAAARAALANPHLFEALGTVEETVARLRAIPGVGDWTAHYIALRAAGEPDAFPASDVGLLRGAAGACGSRPSPAELRARAERWRPWRAYAAQHLWTADARRAS
jgi:AraC family transcriptional regulator of adaptative response / DNA-3-methyladenine glycosylase II